MEQVIIGGYYDLLHTTVTEYNWLWGGYLWTNLPGTHYVPIPAAGTLKKLRVELNDSPGVGNRYRFSLYKDGSASALTVDIEDTATSNEDSVNEVAVSAGDLVCIEVIPDDTPTARYARWSLVFESTNAKESLILSGGASDKTLDTYLSLEGCHYNTVELSTQRVCPTGGTIKDLYVKLNFDPGTAPDAYRITLRIDGASQTLTCTITANDTTGNDTGHDVTVSAGDLLSIFVEPLNGPSVSPKLGVGMCFEADTDGESLILGNVTDDMHATNTEYTGITGAAFWGWGATEAQKYALSQECTLKKLYVQLEAAPSSGDNYTFTVRRSGGSPGSGLVVEIADEATTGNDTSNTIAISDGNEVDMMVVPDSSPDVTFAHWGLVCYLVPSWSGIVSGITNPAKVNSVAAASIGNVIGVV